MSPSGRFSSSELHALLEEYGDWKAATNPHQAKLWRSQVATGGPDQEAAWSEAVAWDWLRTQGEVTSPTEVAGKNPDFRVSGSKGEFVVEVTNISMDAMARATGVPENTRGKGMQFYRSPSFRIVSEIITKASQGRGLKCPFVVLVSTFHPFASAKMLDEHLMGELLHGPESLQCAFDSAQGRAVGDPENVVEFDTTAFTRHQGVSAMRQIVSAVVLGPWAYYQRDLSRLLGVLHPDPRRPLDPALLPRAMFAALDPWPPRDHVGVRWINHSSFPH